MIAVSPEFVSKILQGFGSKVQDHAQINPIHDKKQTSFLGEHGFVCHMERQ